MLRTLGKIRSGYASLLLHGRFSRWVWAIIVFAVLSGCSHYPVNQPLGQIEPRSGHRGRNPVDTDNDDQLLLLMAFSGGGTRAAAFSYGVLETFRDTTVSIRGRKSRLLDQVDSISGVSGGSFTAAYYGIFRDRIFEDFESRFLKKDIQGELARAIFFNPINWVRFFSPFYDRSDLAAEYFDKHVFEGKTFADLFARNEPMIVINATDMVHGTRFSFVQDTFDVICSDFSAFPVSRACAASAAVPMVLSPVTLRSYAGKCGYRLPKEVEEAMNPVGDVESRRLDLANNLKPFLDSEKKPYIHLVDGGVADNLGLRAILERVTLMGSPWNTLKYNKIENVRKIVFVLVNAATEINDKWDRSERIPPLAAMLDSYSSTAIERYNMETVALLRESFPRWIEEIQRGRCGSQPILVEPGSCGDIEFYLVQVKFDALAGETERSLLKQIPTSFVLKPEEVDHLRDAARRILEKSGEFQRLVQDLH